VARIPRIHADASRVCGDSCNSCLPSAGLVVFAGPIGIPAPNSHGGDQPLQSEAPSAQNAGKGTIWSVSATVVDTIYGVPQPLSFPTPKRELLLPKDVNSEGAKTRRTGEEPESSGGLDSPARWHLLVLLKRQAVPCFQPFRSCVFAVQLRILDHFGCRVVPQRTGFVHLYGWSRLSAEWGVAGAKGAPPARPLQARAGLIL
jgi:hypothetical protein